mgnify:CR=1 FL=1
MAAMSGRFEVEDGEIIDTQERQIISLDQFSKLATPEEQASVRQQIQDSGWAGADQTDEADSPVMARGTVTRPGATETPSPQEALPARPSLQQFMEVARQDNPDVPDRDLRRYWAQNYSDIDPKTLPSLESFMTAAKEDNPGVPEQDLKAYWNENYGDFGAAEKDTHLGLTGTLWQGAKSAGRSLKATGQAIIGDEAGVVDTADAQQSAPRDIALQNLLADIQKRKDALGKDPSWLATIGEVGKAALSNPKGAGLLLAEQLPNSALVLGSGLAGAAAGSALGPLGTIAGGIAGLFVANTALETGGKVIEAGADQTFTPEERSRTLKEGLTKGAVITGVDVATLGLTNFITGTTARAVERATVKTLTDAGVDVTDRAAVMAATKNPDIFSAVQAAQQRAQIASNTLGQRLARGGGAIGAEAIGEGAGEYLGEYAATGNADKMEAVIEAFAGLGQSAGEIAATHGLNRKREASSLLQGPAPTPIESIPEQLGVGNPSVSIDQAIKNATGLLSAPVSSTRAQEDALSSRLAQLSATTSAQREADRLESERQLQAGERLPTAQEAALQSDTLPRAGQDIPILEGAQSAPSTLPIAEPSRLWMHEAVIPGIEPGQAFTPRTEPEPDATERLAEERAKLVAMQERSKPASDIAPEAISDTPPQSDIPLQSAADLAYPPSERGRVLSQQELLERGKTASKRTAESVALIDGVDESPSASPILTAAAFSPRQAQPADSKASIQTEREKLVAMRERSRPKKSEESASPDTRQNSTPEDAPLRSAVDLAYPASERGRMLTQAELALRDRMASKRPAQQVSLLEGAQPSQASTIVQGTTFSPRQEPELTAKDRIADEREKLVRMKATRPAPKPSESTVPPSSTTPSGPLRTALDRAYPSVAELHDLARDKGFDVESDVFKTLTKMSTGKSHLDELSPGARDRFAETLKKLTPAKTPEIVESPTKKALAPVKPTEPSSDAVSAPRSALPPEQNAEMLLRAEKASADLDASSQIQDESLIDFLKSNGGLQDQGGELSAMEVDAQRKAFSKKLIQEKGLTLDQAAELAHEAGHIPERDIALLLDGIDKEVRGKGQHADWYRELTTGPKPMTREAIDSAVAKIIEDHGVDTGKAVERVKAALLNDREFDGTQWGEDAAAIARGDWPAWIPKPDAPSQSGSVQTSEPVSASPPTEGTTTTAPQTEAATETPIDRDAHEAASSPQNDRPEPTEAQKEAGNYRKGHLKISGLDISVENPQGSTRSGTDTNGKPWSVTMQHHYGYFRGADFKGKDKEHIDVFVKPGTPEDYSGPVFVIDQKDPQSGRFDEHKTILGASSADEARAIYQANYATDWKGFRSIKQFTMPEFKLWLKAGNKQKPAGMAKPEKRSVKMALMATDRGPGSSPDAQTPPEPGRETVVLYHGTDSRGAYGIIDNGRFNTKVVYLTNDYEAAKRFGGGDDAKVFEVEVDKNDLKMDFDLGSDSSILGVAGANEYEGKDLTIDEWLEEHGSFAVKSDAIKSIVDESGNIVGGSLPNHSSPQQGGPGSSKSEEPFRLTSPAKQVDAPAPENSQTSIDIPPETIGSRPIIGREATPEEAPLFSKAAQEPEAQQAELPEESRADRAEVAPSPTEILASALRTAADQIEGKKAEPKIEDVDELKTKETDQGTALFSQRPGGRTRFLSDDAGTVEDQVAQALDDALPIGSTTWHLLDTSSQYPTEVMESMARRPYVAKLARGMAETFRAIRTRLPAAYRDVRFLGISPDDYYQGVYLGNVSTGSPGEISNVVILNPYGILDATQANMAEANIPPELLPEQYARQLIETITHELTHQLYSHGEEGSTEDHAFEKALAANRALVHDVATREVARWTTLLTEPINGQLAALDEIEVDRDALRPYYVPEAGNALGEARRRSAGRDGSEPIRREANPRRRAGPGLRSGGDLSEEAGGTGTTRDESVPSLQGRRPGSAGFTDDDLNSPNFPGIPAQQQQAALTYHLPAMSRMDTVIRSIQDKNIDIVRLVDSIKKAGASIPDELNPVLREELYMGRVTASTQGFLNGELRPLVDAMRLNKVTLEQLDSYLHARHAKEANAHLKAINPDRENNDALSGMTDAEAERILAAADRSKMDRLAAKVDAILGKTRQMLVDYGLESQGTVDGWAKDYQYYVPLHREGYEEGSPGTGQGRSVRGSHSKSRTGSTLSVTNILANVAMDRERAIVRGEKMRPVIALAGLLQQYPNKEIATLAKPSQITYTNPDTGLQEVAAGDIGEYRVPRIKGLNKKTGMVEWRPDPLYKGRDNVVNFRIKGQDHAIIFNEENDRAVEMAKSLKDLDVGRLNGLLAAIAPATRYLSSISTQYNPVFGVVNFVRDIQFAMLSLSSTPLAHKRADIFRGTFRALKGIYADARAERRGESVNSEMSKLWERFQKVGGPTGYREMFRGSNDRAKAIEHMLNPDWWQQTLGGKILTANGHLSGMQSLILNKAAKPLFEWLSDYNQTMENAVRLATFKAGLDSGMTDEQAASTAKNLTVNFNKKGSITTQVGALYAFFNASVQGTARIAETLFEKDRLGYLSATGKKIVAGGIALGAMQAIGLMMAGFGEDEPPEFVRARSLILPMPGTEKGYLAIPMPLGFNILPNFGRLVAESMIHGKPMDRAYTFMANLVDTFSPVGGAGSVSQFLAPSVADPLVALSENKDWAGRKISKEDFNSMKPTPGHTRAKDSSTPWARGLSEAINYATGGTNYVPGKFSPTPDAIDYLIGSLTGGVGRELAHTAQSVTGLTTGEDVPLHKVPLVGRFVGDAAGPSAVRNDFYDNLTDVHRAYEEVHGRMLHHEDATDFLAEHPEARLEKAATHLQREISQLTKRKREMVAKGENRERVRLLEMQISSRMQRFNDRVKELQETR